ncbi:LytTR family DNA-binding domain-containing protein [Roseivirga sp. E12]|uniref:LytR/AlgR family response regulator transcription factor n=1 Tax=Roseivirga sp. E12 TaxID=2819237 RepID=UPI001ABCD4E7|nr:LytTR family DNA-binding domain-containing protein [Roseivirga sp. E12]MBO3699422.1 LytTR family transcriptional regulator [Roseivirga sp. E12]
MPKTSILSPSVNRDSKEAELTGLVLLVLIVISLIVWGQNYIKNITNEAFSIKLSLIYNLVVYGSFAFSTPFLLRFARKFPLSKDRLHYLFHFGFSILMVGLHMVCCNLLLFSINLSSVPILDRFVTKYLTNVVHIHLLSYWAIVLIATYYFKERKERVEAPEKLLRRFEIRENGRLFYIDFANVLWVEALDHYQKVHTPTGYHLISQTMKGLEVKLPTEVFGRAHRSYFINKEHIQSIYKKSRGSKGTFVMLSDGTELKLGESYKSSFTSH